MLSWSLLLSLALLCVQGSALHVHHLAQDHDESANHSHLSNIHFTYGASHDGNHDGLASEVNISPDGLLKNFSGNALATAFFALFFALVLVCSRRRVLRYRESKLILQSYYLLSPPLRAPPQH